MSDNDESSAKKRDFGRRIRLIVGEKRMVKDSGVRPQRRVRPSAATGTRRFIRDKEVPDYDCRQLEGRGG